MLTEPSVATALPVIQTPWQNQWQPELIGTLVFLVDNERVLLIEKLTGHGQGKINGPGGKWEEGDKNLYETALRESKEEINLDIKNLKKLGLVSVSRTGAVAMTRGSEVFK